MVQMAVEDGITHIVATPHANDLWTYDRERNARLLEEIRAALPEATAERIALGLGCDFHLSYDNIEDARVHGRRYSINENEYLLVELPDQNLPPRLEEVLYQMRVDGLTPILTHPERNVTLQREPQRMEPWLESGLLVQVTAGSLTGTFGPKAEEMGWQMLRDGQVHFIASDAHNLERRPPVMSRAFQAIAERMGSETAERLCIVNPLAVFEGRALPEAPEVVEMDGDADEEEAEARLPFWKRFFGR